MATGRSGNNWENSQNDLETTANEESFNSTTAAGRPGAIRIAGMDDIDSSTDPQIEPSFFPPVPEEGFPQLGKSEKLVSDFQFGEPANGDKKIKDDLPEAVLIQEKDEEPVDPNNVVTAEIVEDANEEPETTAIGARGIAAAVLLVVLVVIISVVLVVTRDDTPQGPTVAPTEYVSPTPTDIASETPTLSPTSAPLVFSNEEELRSAVRAFASETESFDVPMNRWIVSSITDFSGLFNESSPINFDVGDWDVSNAENMAFMFNQASVFNQDLSKWNTSKVTSMEFMFHEATSFDQKLDTWDVSKVQNFRGMFAKVSEFKGDSLSSWNTISATDMSLMFQAAIGFNADLSGWVVDKVTSMEGMFNEAAFDGDLLAWNTSSVLNMAQMFMKNTQFNRGLADWDVSRVTDMTRMFEGTNFDQDVSSWDVSAVLSFERMFADSQSFNQNLEGWDVTTATNFQDMFNAAGQFDQGLCAWGDQLDDSDLVNGMFADSQCTDTRDPERTIQSLPRSPLCASC